MEPVLSSKEIQTAISNYLEVNKPEIKAKIDKKIDLAVTAAINEAFSNGYNGNGWARKAVFDAVNGAAKPIIAKDITIDTEKIHEKVQKQVVPQVVADYISKEKDGGYTLYGAFTFMARCTKEVPSLGWYTGVSETALFKRKATKVHKWVIDGHQNAFALAWIYGYKVREQLYYVWFLKDDEESFLNISATDRMVCSNEHERNNYRTKFTMAEIEAIDPRYKAFAVPVEEVDE